jgi:flagellar hook-length control protein FliK
MRHLLISFEQLMPQLIEQLIQQELQLIQLPLSFSSFTAPLIFEIEP